MAKLARDQGVVVPREYVFYDHETGEHLDRPSMMFLRHELAEKQKVVGILFADLRCLSREPAPQQVFERVCEIMGVKLIFGDAPSGMDVGSQFARSAITFSNKLARLATNRNARAGNIGRVLKGWVPSHRAPYGYIYRRDAEIVQGGRIQIKKAWWEVNSLDPDGKPVPGSPADVITKVFNWIGKEGRTVHWVAGKLDEMGIKGPGGAKWASSSLHYIMLNHCYTGQHRYNANVRGPNPGRPLGDITGAVRRTLNKPKPEGEAVGFSISPLVSEELWIRANRAIKERGCGRGKEGKAIAALLRNRLFCPRCGKPMVVRRNTKSKKVYYLCSRLYHATETQHCSYRRFIPGVWDDVAWDCVYSVLKDQSWLQGRLSELEGQNQTIDKLIRSEHQKIFQIQTKIAKVREGFEGGLYDLNEAKSKVNGYQEAIDKAEKEIGRLTGIGGHQSYEVNIDELKKELERLAQSNLNKATFTEKHDIISKLGIMVYPSEDLKTMKIKCSLNFRNNGGSQQPHGCGIIQFGSPINSIPHRVETFFEISM